jgi:hypothetical protein
VAPQAGLEGAGVGRNRAPTVVFPLFVDPRKRAGIDPALLVDVECVV